MKGAACAVLIAGLLETPWAARADDTSAIFALAERTEAGTLVPYPDAPTVDVDVNSSVLIRLNSEALKQLGAPDDPGAVDRLTARLLELAKLEQEFGQAARNTLDVVAVSQRARSEGRAMTADERHRYQTAAGLFATLLRSTRAYLTATRADGEEVFSNLVMQSPGNPGPPVLALMAKEHSELAALVRQGVAHQDSKVLELAAWIGSPPAQIHIPGYDNLVAGEVHLIDKTHFNFDDHFQAEYSAAQQVSRSAWNLGSLRGAAQSAVAVQVATLRRDLSELPQHLQAVVDLGGSSADPKAPKVVAVVEAARALEADVRALSDELGPVLAKAESPPAGTDPGTLIASTVSAIQSALPRVQECVTKLRALTNATDQASVLLPGGPGAVGEVAVRMTPFADAASQAAVASIPPLSSIDVPLSTAHDAEVSLVQTSRKQGDVVTIRARVLDGDRVLAGEETTRHLRVRSRGIVADTGASVLLVRPLAPNPGAFLPAAGAYAVIRFMGWRSAGEANSNFFQVLAPGVGVAAIAIPQSVDGSTKVAWVGTLQLFGDILQVGVGTTTDAKPIWGVGLGLHRIAGIGAYLQ